MDDVPDFDTIDIEVDEDLTKKQISRCTDDFLTSICEEELDNIDIPEVDQFDEDEAVNTDGEGVNERENGDDEEQEENGEYEEQLQYTTHDPSVKWNRMQPVIGERYETHHQLKLCLTNYAIRKWYKIRFKKCDSVRLVAVCGCDPEKFQCPWFVRASWMSTERSFQIKKMCDQHKCVRSFNTAKLMDPTWIARQLLKELIRQPKLKCKEMQAIIQSKFHCKISWSKCYRARCRAMSLIEGKLSDHYARVWDYGHELIRSNPGSSIKICVDPNPDGTTTFSRIYICFKAMQDGWKLGCRKVIGLDGSFLKAQCKGELLTAIGRDANNQVYPIAWAVVNVENKDNWKWFIELIEQDLYLDGGRGLSVISDQHKVSLCIFS